MLFKDGVTTGLTTFFFPINHNETTEENEQKVFFELYKEVEHEIMKALLSGEILTIQLLPIVESDNGAEGDDTIVYALGVSILKTFIEDTKVGEYVLWDADGDVGDILRIEDNNNNNITFLKLDEFGWKRIDNEEVTPQVS